MKNILILTLLFAFLMPVNTYCQTKSINKFYRKYKYKKHARNISLPGWLIRMGAGIAKQHVEDEEEKLALAFAKKIRKAKFMLMEEGDKVKPKDIAKLMKGLKKESFDDLLQIRDGKTTINMMIRDEGETIRNLFVLVKEPDELIMLSLKTKFTMKDINQLLETMEVEYNINIELPTKSDETPVDPLALEPA